MLTRRRFLEAGGAALLGAAFTGARPVRATAAPAVLPDPSTAPFDHVVVVMLENRSFDHFLGWLPGADGHQAGLAYTDTSGTTYPTYDLAPDFQGCGYKDPDHSWEGGAKQLNGGAVDGFLITAAPGDTFPIGYYTEASVPVLGALARSYTTLDRYFCAILAETFPNRFYMHCARTDRNHNLGITQSPLDLAIWDRLNTAGVSGKYYFSDEPFLGLFGTAYASNMQPYAAFLAACDPAVDLLPAVSFIDPGFALEDEGLSGDQHPHGDIRTGDAFLSEIYAAVRASKAWDRTVMVVTYDEWGGFYDHVVPPKVTDDSTGPLLADPNPANPDYGQLGFRVPCVVISPFAAARVVSDGPYEHCSILRMIEWRWGLAPMTARDANARNLAEVLDLTSARTDAPDIPLVAALPVSVPCNDATSVKAKPPAPISGPPSSSTTTTAVQGGGSGGGGILPKTGGPELLAGAAAATAVALAARRVARQPTVPDPPT